MRVHENILPSFHSFFSSQPACLSPFLHFNHIYTLDWKKNRSILDQMFFDVKWGHYLYQNIYYIKTVYAAAAAKSLQSCPTLGNPIDGSPPGSPIPGILQARTLEWVAISFSNSWKWKVKVKSESEVPQSCPTLWDPMDGSLPGSSAHGIFQARVLEWGAIAFSV